MLLFCLTKYNVKFYNYRAKLFVLITIGGVLLMEKYYIHFTNGKDAVCDSGDFKVTGTKNMEFITSGKKMWGFNDTSRLYLTFDVKSNKSYNLAMHLMTSEAHSGHDLRLEVGINNHILISYTDIYDIANDLVITLQKGELNVGTNSITLDVTYNNGPKLYIDYVVIEEVSSFTSSYENPSQNSQLQEKSNQTLSRPSSNSIWMSNIYDDTPLAGVSIPGTHDSCAIRTGMFRSMWSCQDHSIREQLLVDIRVGLKGTSPNDLVTCHGSGFFSGVYEKLYLVFDAVTAFLNEHRSECVVMTLKIEDWADYSNRHDAGKRLLLSLLNRYRSFLYISDTCPNIGAVRGKIYLINRIDDSLNFGAPISIPDNTKGVMLEPVANRRFKVYVQDNYGFNLSPFSAHDIKWEAVKNEMDLRYDNYKKNNSTRNDMYLCYCNGFRLGFGVYVMKDILDYLGANTPPYTRPFLSPWMFFDYPFWEYRTNQYGYMNVVDAIIDLNYALFNPRYPKKYSCSEYDEL